MPLNRPTRKELENALALHRQSPPADANVARFHDRIAAHLSQLVEREQTLAAQFDETESRALSSLIDPAVPLEQANEWLCDKLDKGLPPEWLDQLLPALLDIARAKLAIDNPRYLAHQSD